MAPTKKSGSTITSKEDDAIEGVLEQLTDEFRVSS